MQNRNLTHIAGAAPLNSPLVLQIIVSRWYIIVLHLKNSISNGCFVLKLNHNQSVMSCSNVQSWGKKYFSISILSITLLMSTSARSEREVFRSYDLLHYISTPKVLPFSDCLLWSAGPRLLHGVTDLLPGGHHRQWLVVPSRPWRRPSGFGLVTMVTA